MESLSNTMIRGLIGEDFVISRATTPGSRNWRSQGQSFSVLAYKQEYSYLSDGIDDNRALRTESGEAFRAVLYDHGNAQFAVRYVGGPDSLDSSLRELSSLNCNEFEHFSFEPVLGYLLEPERSNDVMMIHRQSGGVDFYAMRGLSDDTIRNDISLVAARALAELHGRKITYSDTVPTHFRTHLDCRIVIDPHSHVRCGSSDERERFEDLMILLQTNPWIPDRVRFLAEYLGEMVRHGVDTYSSAHELNEQIADEWSWLIGNMGLPGIKSIWKHPGQLLRSM